MGLDGRAIDVGSYDEPQGASPRHLDRNVNCRGVGEGHRL
jgi:hypothetical protein